MKRVVSMVLFGFFIGMCCACNAVTPGPSTTRSSAVVMTTSPSAENEEVNQNDLSETLYETEDELRETDADQVEESSDVAAESTSVDGHTMYTTAGINVRDGASADSQIVGQLEYGTRVTVIGEEGNWAIILYEGEQRYVSFNYLSDYPEE